MLSPHGICLHRMVDDFMIYRVRHTITYAYSGSVSVSHNEVHLGPREGPHQTCSFHELLVFPEPAVLNQTADFFGNPVTFFAVQEPHYALTMILVMLAPSRGCFSGVESIPWRWRSMLCLCTTEDRGGGR